MTRPGEGRPDSSTDTSAAHDADRDKVTKELEGIAAGPLGSEHDSTAVKDQVTAEVPPPPATPSVLRSTVVNTESSSAGAPASSSPSPSVISTVGGSSSESDSSSSTSAKDPFDNPFARLKDVDASPGTIYSDDRSEGGEHADSVSEVAPEEAAVGHEVGSDNSPDSKPLTPAEVDKVDSAEVVLINGREYPRGAIVSYTSKAGKQADYYLLCNTFGDPAGVVLQSTSDEHLVFGLDANSANERVSAPTGTPEPPTPTDPPEPPVDPPAPPEPPEPTPGPYDHLPPPPDSPGNTEGETGEAFPEFEASKADLEEAIQRLARAKDRSDSIFSGLHRKSKNESGLDDKGELQAASDHLKDVFAGYVGAVAGVCVEQTGPMRRDMERLGRTVLRDPNNPAAGYVAGVDPAMISRYEQARNSMNEVELGMTQMIVQEMASARYRVDQAQLEIKKSKPGGKFISKFRELWTKHPGWRAGIGAALTVGAIGASTVAPPLGLGLFAAKRAFATFGTYMGVEGAGRKVTSMKSEREEKKAAAAGLEAIGEQFPRSGVRDVVENRSVEYGSESLGAGGVEAGEAFPDEQRVNIERFVQDKYKDIMLDPEGLRAILRGAEVSPAAVVDTLMEDRLVRLRRDSKWTRRSKYLAAAGAVVVGAASLNQIKNALDARPHVPTPGGASKEDLNKAFFKGIELHHGPTTGADFEHLKAGGMANAQKLWEASPNHVEVGKAFANGAWMDKLQGLSASDQIKAATLIGNQFDTGSLSEASINSIVTALS